MDTLTKAGATEKSSGLGILICLNRRLKFILNPQLVWCQKYSNQLQRKIESTLQEMKVIQEKLGMCMSTGLLDTVG